MYTILILYLRFLIPIALLYWGIKKYPFYKSYPIMLPFMIICFAIVFLRMVKYSKRTNHMVHQILLDPTGTELTFVFKNQFLRNMRQDNVERTLMIANLANPPQQGEYRELVGDLFPEEYPFDYSRIFDYRYFWIKYYMSQRNLFAIPKK